MNDEEKRTENILSNIKTVSARIAPQDAHTRTAIVFCYGPSLKDTWEQIKDGDIVSVSGSHDFLIERGLVPKFHIECDPRPHKAKHINLPRDDVEYLLASCVHPNVLEKVSGKNVKLWHSCDGKKLVELVKEHDSGQWIIMGGGSVGLRALSVLYGLGYRKFVIHGMDCSFVDDGLTQHAGYHAGNRQAVIRTSPEGSGEWFATSPVLVTYAWQFLEFIRKVPDARFTLKGHGLLQAMCRQSMKQKVA